MIRATFRTLRGLRPKSDTELPLHWARSELANRPPARAVCLVWMVRSGHRGAADGVISRCGRTVQRDRKGREVRWRYFPRSHRIEAPQHRAASAASAATTAHRITQLGHRIRNALSAEHLSCVMTADQTGASYIRVCLSFSRARQAAVLDAFKPVRGSRRRDLFTGAGALKIVGHTDTTRSVRAFPSTFELSSTREGLAAVAQAGLADSNPVDIDG